MNRTFLFSVMWPCACLLSCLAAEVGEVNIRVKPQASAAHASVFRLGLRAGFGETTETLLRAECLTAPSIAPGASMLTLTSGTVRVTQAAEPIAGQTSFTVANNGNTPGGMTLTTALLRKGVSHTLRFTCRVEQGNGALLFRFSPVNGSPGQATGKRVTVKGSNQPCAIALAVTPHRDGAFTCAFQLDPGGVMTFSGFSLLPGDAQEGWDSQVVEALRLTGAGFVRWSAQASEGALPYNWYAGVGPFNARAANGQGFGTAEAVRMCRLIGAEPVFQVPVLWQAEAESRDSSQPLATALAADWVAYCNATGDHPLALLRKRHGFAEPFDIKQWELVHANGTQQNAPGVAVACAACATAMKAEDGSIAATAMAADVPDAPGVPDAYVARVLARLATGEEQERTYFYAWYDALGKIGTELRRKQQGTACAMPGAPFELATVLQQGLYAPHRLSGAGWLMSLVNRFPTTGELVTEGKKPEGETGSFWAQAAWSEDASAIVVFIYNSGPETQKVRLDLTALSRRFVFYAYEQVAADITAQRLSPTVPVVRRQKAGSAMTQIVLCEAAPASLTRVLVRGE